MNTKNSPFRDSTDSKVLLMPIFSYSLKKIVVIIYLEPQLIITVLPNWHRDQINEIIIQLEPKPINN